jgi:Leucine-rich repeat (LRR) protein
MNNKIYPFKFLDSYTAEDKDIFFGREEEIDQLYQMIYQSDILLLYGASGTGKTSLIQCGLASKFQKHDWLEIFVRRHKNLNESLNKSLIAVGGQNEVSIGEASENLEWLNDIMKGRAEANVSTKTWSQSQVYLKNIYLKHFRPIYLIFDQFEELFILGSKAEQAQFIATVQEILKVEQPVKLIFSIREEYLGSLYEFEKAVPELFRKKLRIDPMNLANVKDVVLGATRSKKSIVHINDGEAEAIAEQVFEKIRGTEKTLTIQLPYLQVFLDKFYRHISKDKSKSPTTEATFSLESLAEIGDIGNILRDFLDEQIVEIANDQRCERRTIWKILSPFVTIDGTKEPIGIDTLDHNFPEIPKKLIEHVVIALMNNRILRYIEEEELYEIAHDSLALRIAEKRSDDEIALLEVRNLIKSQSLLKDEARELFSEKQLDFISPFLTRIKLSPEETLLIEESKKKVLQSQKEATRKKVLGAIFLGLVFITIFSFAVISNNEKVIAKAAQLDAEAANEKNIKIINAMDFYDGKLALAFKNGKYGFIDKDGNPSPNIDFVYQKGEPFDVETGFAEMETMNPIGSDRVKYLIDTSGNRYRLVEISEVLKEKGIFKSSLSKEDISLLKSRLTKNKKQKNLLSKLEDLESSLKSINQSVAYDLNKHKDKLALDFKDLGKNDVLNILQYLAKDPKIKDRVELLFFDRNLDTFPDFITTFEHLSQIDIYSTDITSIPENIDRLKGLKALELPSTIENVPSSIYNLQHLEILNLYDTGVEMLPEAIGKLKKLKILGLPMSLKKIPLSVYSLEHLEELYLTGQEETTLSASILKLKKLKTLFLLISIDEFSSHIEHLENLEVLHLQMTGIKAIPESIGKLKKLKDLYLPAGLEKIPLSIYSLQNLNLLDVSSEAITELPEGLENLIDLEHLHLSGTSLKTIPGDLGKLIDLQVLELPPSLEILPKGIENLINLEKLYLENNPNLKNIPDVSKMRKLKYFSLTLYKNEDYAANLAKLEALQEKLPDCSFIIKDEEGDYIYLSAGNN